MASQDLNREQLIRRWVERTLSLANDLVPGAFPMTEQVIVKQGNKCGRLYCLHGPRSVRLVAVHDFITDRVLTYDAQGARTAETASTQIVVDTDVPCV
jgi:hypothetical protein